MFGRTILGVLAVDRAGAPWWPASDIGLQRRGQRGHGRGARAAAAAGDPVVVYPPYVGGRYGYGYGWGGGFGFFGILFWILGFFLIFGLIRAAFGWGRWGGGGPRPRWLGVAPGPDGGAPPRAASARRAGATSGRMTAHGSGGAAGASPVRVVA